MSDEVAPLVATSSQTVGPFFAIGLTTNTELTRVAPPDAPGDRIQFLVRVFDGDGTPVPDAMIELWQAASDGTFLFGRSGTDEGGAGTFDTVRPGLSSTDASPPGARHINVCLFMRGLLRHLYTRVYFPDDPGLRGDAVLGLVPENRRETLMAQPAQDSPGTWVFTIRLQGERETVFFDL
jgi:protocatechuate 3,4-dioxygenase alpha subunit